jgi:hypothetical protein
MASSARSEYRHLAAVLLLLSVPAQPASGHGGVVEEEDACVIRFSYLKAHFTVYQPRTSGREEYCEDLPDAAESVFVLEYLHDQLATVPIDFRIVRNVTGKGRFARLKDIEAIEDLDAATVYYREPVIEPDVFTVVHEFEDEGSYIGIVNVFAETAGRRHVAVFPFDVGFTGLGYWPWIVAAVILIQIQYLWMSGRIARWRAGRRTRTPELKVLRGGLDED